jgi:Domain of unknown function (DUF4349)
MKTRHIGAILFAATALAGCASAASGAGNAGSAVHVPLAPAQTAGGPAPDSLGAADKAFAAPNASIAGIIVGTPPSSDIERSVTAAYTVPAGSFLTSFSGVIARAVSLGGYVVSSNTQPNSSGRIVSGGVTMKVPAPKIADFLNGMPPTFVASSINFSTIDHTAQFVDINARLASAHAHLHALDALLAKATSINDITNLEQQIEAVQAEIDTDQGELNVLAASVELATATVHMSERGAAVARVPVPNPVSGGISGGWSNAVRVTGAALEGVVSAVPLLVLLAAGLLVWRGVTGTPLWRRRSRSAG